MICSKSNASKEHAILALSNCKIQARSRHTLAQEREFVAHTSTINEICVSQTAPWNIISCSSDGYVKVWDLRTQGNPSMSIRVGSEVWSCSAGCGETLLVAGTDEMAQFFDLRNGSKVINSTSKILSS